jgi:hypothetical protein
LIGAREGVAGKLESQALLGSHQPEPAVKSYECVFLNAGGKVAGSVELTAADDAAAIAKARVAHHERSRD